MYNVRQRLSHGPRHVKTFGDGSYSFLVKKKADVRRGSDNLSRRILDKGIDRSK